MSKIRYEQLSATVVVLAVLEQWLTKTGILRLRIPDDHEYII